MEKEKQIITENWENRLKLMELLIKINASEELHLMVEKVLSVANNKEKTAQKIVDIIIKEEENIPQEIEMIMFKEALISLICSINKKVKIKEENQVLLVLKLNSKEKIYKFNQWVKLQTSGNKFNATESQIMRAAVEIDKQN